MDNTNLQNITREKLNQKKFRLGEKVWYMLAGLVPVLGTIHSSDVCEEKYRVIVYSQARVSFRFFEAFDYELGATKDELLYTYNQYWAHL